MKKHKIIFKKQINFLYYVTILLFIANFIINIVSIVGSAGNITNAKTYGGTGQEIAQNSVSIIISSVFFLVVLIAFLFLSYSFFRSYAIVSEKFITYKYGIYKKQVKHIQVIGIKVHNDVVIVFYKKNGEEKFIATMIKKTKEQFLNDIKEFNPNLYVERD